ncbi:hypothetical protein HAX54_020274, partial [Datura stramonium]|nr:hypothetical protein [Datura stramonium]
RVPLQKTTRRGSGTAVVALATLQWKWRGNLVGRMRSRKSADDAYWYVWCTNTTLLHLLVLVVEGWSSLIGVEYLAPAVFFFSNEVGSFCLSSIQMELLYLSRLDLGRVMVGKFL